MYTGEDKPKKPKRVVSLFTTLAYECPDEARNFLRRHGMPDAVNNRDLENKIVEFYFKSDDQLDLEKEMAAIHPHKDWLIRTLKLAPESAQSQANIQTIKEAVMEAQAKNQPDPKILSKEYSNCEGGCSSCRFSKTSAFSGSDTPQDALNTQKILHNYIGLIGLVAVVGLTYYFINKQKT